jgi:hypothetical protein
MVKKINKFKTLKIFKEFINTLKMGENLKI